MGSELQIDGNSITPSSLEVPSSASESMNGNLEDHNRHAKSGQKVLNCMDAWQNLCTTAIA